MLTKFLFEWKTSEYYLSNNLKQQSSCFLWFSRLRLLFDSMINNLRERKKSKHIWNNIKHIKSYIVIESVTSFCFIK